MPKAEIMGAVIRVDASVRTGTGHAMRCLTLAEELRRNSVRVDFICSDLAGNVNEIIREKGFSINVVSSAGGSGNDHDWENDLKTTRQVLGQRDSGISWIIVDHYGLGQEWEKGIRSKVDRIMVIDDLSNRKHDCDLLLDQNFYLKENRYHGLVPEACVQLIGPRYALLRQEFAQRRENLRKRPTEIKNVLIFFGGSDPSNETEKAINAFKQLNRNDLSAKVVLGSSNPFIDSIKQAVETVPNMECLVQVENMAELISEADLALGAVGSVTWERCALGLPSIVSITAENQVELTLSLAEKKFIHFIGNAADTTTETYAQAIRHLSVNREEYINMVDSGLELVDGKGAQRVVETMMEIHDR